MQRRVTDAIAALKRQLAQLRARLQHVLHAKVGDADALEKERVNGRARFGHLNEQRIHLKMLIEQIKARHLRCAMQQLDDVRRRDAKRRDERRQPDRTQTRAGLDERLQ